MQGTQNNDTNPLVREVVDLDALLVERSLEPVPMKLGGKTFKVRTDLTGEECTQFIKLVNDEKDLEAFTILVGKRDAVVLNNLMDKMPREHAALVSSHLMRSSRALAQYAITDEQITARYGEPGESQAS